MNRECYIGIMSGTSLDGVDIVLCEIDETKCKFICALEYPMPFALKTDILCMIEEKSSLEKMGQIDHRLGELFAQAVEALIVREEIDPATIQAIGLHGQTVWHEPNGKTPFTMQLGDPNILTTTVGIKVVSDFRRKDIVLGGQGAPLAPAFHEFIFTNIKSKVAVVNIGGMANITLLDDMLLGYDTGCGNVLLDLWINEHINKAYDKDGAWARLGRVDVVLLKQMLKDDFFTQPHPKSTGREKFNKSWLQAYLIGKTHTPEDVQRTLLELTATSIVNEVLKFDRETVLLCGGGAKNGFLVERIKTLLPQIEVHIAPHADMIEAMTFAWLAYKRLHNEKVNIKDVTGARENAVLGGVYV
ncbi:MAG: anhydro-N-acetylmuramic acid kinase [Campylobacterota bacterium]|nr:anhydro-N-acetylmuramic acid kinase [Campylobacterota bacterium]